MNRGQVLAVDFEKRELKDTQQNSDNDNQSFYRNKTKICNDAVTIFQTAKSGGIWHMRAYVGDADKYFAYVEKQMQYACNNELKQVLRACLRQRLSVINGTNG